MIIWGRFLKGGITLFQGENCLIQVKTLSWDKVMIGIRQTYPWNRVIPPFRDRPLENIYIYIYIYIKDRKENV